MKIILANPRGFCAGVNMAIECLERALEVFGPPLYVYHEIVHNKFVVERFRDRGTIFVDRRRSLQVADATREIEQALRAGIPVLLFPEGTSSDGSSVLPFRSPLFDPAIRAGASVTAAAVRYHAADATEDQVTYWGDMVFLPHLFRTLCVRGLTAEIGFDSPCRFPDRKCAAREAWRQVHLLRMANEL